MRGMFVNSDGRVDYAIEIMAANKPIETRAKNMLSALVGERIAVVRTKHGQKPMVIGTVYMPYGVKVMKEAFDAYRKYTLIPEGSKYDCKGAYKWCYWLKDPVECEPFPLPDEAVRHGRSWCEFEMEGR